MQHYRGRSRLLSIVPITYACGLIIAAYVLAAIDPSAQVLSQILLYLLVPVLLLYPAAAIWATIQCFKREANPWKYFPLIWLVPMGFMWYYVEKYPPQSAMR